MDAFGFSEPQVAVQPVADVVSVQEIGVVVTGHQLFLGQVGNGRLARTGQAGEPHTLRRLALEPGAHGLVDIQCLLVAVLGAAQGKVDHPGTDRAVGLVIDDDT